MQQKMVQARTGWGGGGAQEGAGLGGGQRAGSGPEVLEQSPEHHGSTEPPCEEGQASVGDEGQPARLEGRG